jgi:enoyl-CoA hydratase/carnithine racemase
MSTMGDWIEAASAEIGIDPAATDRKAVLDLARQVAHLVDRPAAPLSAFMLGVAVGGGQELQLAVDRLLDLAARWEGRESPAESPAG